MRLESIKPGYNSPSLCRVRYVSQTGSGQAWPLVLGLPVSTERFRCVPGLEAQAELLFEGERGCQVRVVDFEAVRCRVVLWRFRSGAIIIVIAARRRKDRHCNHG